MNLRALGWLLLLTVFASTGFAQPDGKVRAPFKVAITTNPAILAVGHIGLAVDYRAFPRHSFGFEYTNMSSALHVVPSPDTIPTLDNWLDAKGSRFFVRYKLYPFFIPKKVRLSNFYLSAQFMYRRIEFPTAPLEYFELTQTYRKNVNELRTGGRLDILLGTDIPIGDYFIVGGYAGIGLGMERIQQFNLEEMDLTGVPAPGRQFFTDEPDFFRNLISARAGIVLGFTIPNTRRR